MKLVLRNIPQAERAHKEMQTESYGTGKTMGKGKKGKYYISTWKFLVVHGANQNLIFNRPSKVEVILNNSDSNSYNKCLSVL